MAQHEILQVFVSLFFGYCHITFTDCNCCCLSRAAQLMKCSQAFACFSNWTGTGLALSLSLSKRHLPAWLIDSGNYIMHFVFFLFFFFLFFLAARLDSNLCSLRFVSDIRLLMFGWLLLGGDCFGSFIGSSCCCSFDFALLCVCGTFCTFYGARIAPQAP